MKMENYKTIKVSVLEGHILKVALSRPDVLNALNQDMFHELHEVFTYAKVEHSIKALLITGEGKAFCAGADINRLAELNAITGQQFAEDGQAVFRQLETLGKPSLAAVNGYAFGGGCELAMSATMRIASEKAQFGQPEVKLGVIPGYGGTQRLARLIGKGRALDLCLTGRFISATEAMNYGLVSDVVEADQLADRALEILNNLSHLAPLAMQSIMTTIDNGYDLSLEDAMHLEAVHFGRVCSTADRNEGVSAFIEKRKPEFTGS